MAEIMPFNGVLYNEEKVGDLNKVMAPPYDVISPKKQDEFYSRHQNNVIRLILSKASPEDTEGNDKYTRAAADLKKWLSEGVLAKDNKPAIYYYTQTYALKNGKKQTRKGFIALARLVDFGKGIHPHEKTLSGPKADRLKLMQACNVNLSCIFSLYSEPALNINHALDGATKGVKAIIDVKDDDGIENRMWRVDDPGIINEIAEGMKGKPLFIADGHHRYETALNYRNMMREKETNPTGLEPYNYVMMYFSNMDDEGMTIWPTHRVIHSLNDFNGGSFLAECGKYFDIEEFAYNDSTEPDARKSFLARLEAAGREKIALGLHIRATDIFYVFTVKSGDVMGKVFGDKIPEVFKNLDVTVLHSLILNNILGITQEAQEKQTNLIYVKSYDEALSAMKKDENQLVFLLNPTRIEQVKAVAEAGFVMPQKSTYFYPKLLSGLVINLLSSKNTAAAEA
ncbi:MAG: DUF1015 domain-containing protein [Deltaproteobacteria bacterium]|nr:DUF1015 domain-containing protein [Deltaproteobacteria bacterium]